MIPNPYSGIFIVIDGIDGCGKSTQVKLLAEWLKRETYGVGRVVLETKEPDKTGLFGKLIYADLAKENGLHVTEPALFQTWYTCDSKIHLQKQHSCLSRHVFNSCSRRSSVTTAELEARKQ